MTQETQGQQQVRVNRQLVRAAKIEALKEGRTLYEWLNEAIREKLDRHPPQPER